MAEFKITSSVKISGSFLKKMERSVKIWEDEMRTTLNIATENIKRRVQAGIPVNTSNLRGKTFSDIRGVGLNIHGIVANPSVYAFPVEKGRGADKKWPNIIGISQWVKRKLGLSGRELESATFLIGQKIQKKGITGRFMFRQAFDFGKTYVQTLLDNTVRKIIARLK